jgi:DNA-binding response OmpR family regulator
VLALTDKPTTIVYIEDEPEMIELVRLILGRHNYEVIGALGGNKGLETVANVLPDLVLLDLAMPEIGGWEVLQKIKSSETIRDIPVIVITAKSQGIDQVFAQEVAPVDDYITKPFGPGDLLDSIQRILERNMAIN